MPVPLTKEEKEAKRARDNLKLLHNSILMDFSVKKISRWEELHNRLGGTSEMKGEIKFPDLKAFFEKQKNGLEVKRVEQPLSDFKQITRPIGVDESSDCSVLAISTVLGLPYAQIQQALTEEGRKTQNGIRNSYLSEYILSIGFKLVNEESNLTLSKALEICGKKGKFLVREVGHVFAVIDGIIHDCERPKNNVIIKSIWQLDLKANTKNFTLEVQEPVVPSSLHDAKHNYGLEVSKNWSKEFFPYWFQKKAGAEGIEMIKAGKRGILILSGTGTGKTFIVGIIDRWLIDHNYHEGKTWSHIPRLYITKTTVVEQTRRVFKKKFNIEPNVDTEIINIEMLRSKAGQLWVTEKMKVEQGKEKFYWEWKKNIHPCVVYLDESQGAKNKGSTQSQIIYAYNDIPKNTCLICISATPFVRVSEAKAFAVATHCNIESLGFPEGTFLTNENWNSFASAIAAPSKPEDYNQAAVERLMDFLKDYIVRVRGVKPQFEAINGVIYVQPTAEEKEFIDTAYERFLEEKAKIDAACEAGDSAGVCYLVILLKWAMAAEFCHARHFARDMYKAWKERGKAPVAAVKFKQTLIEIVRILIEEYGISRDNISLIWGGGQTKLTKKQETKSKLKEMEEKFKRMGLSVEEMIGDMGLEDVEDRVIKDYPKEWRLEGQSLDERQKEIDKFQSGRSQFALYTLKAGGVGLSLHHTDELTTFKCRRKESGYVVEEDIPKVPVRPRETFVVVTYNAIELVQGVGRVPRLTSLSPTIQNVYCFAGTVEVDMGRIYSQKLRCLSSVVKMKESWQDIIMGGANRAKVVEDALRRTEGIADESSTMIEEGDEEEDE